ncbi:MAG: class I SAM-dependent rRNA methyltransferase [Bacteroidia bacterium]|nr:MAG: class I SAM-dependent rRNA methyltransferase [Bacteroidia bacterium]
MTKVLKIILRSGKDDAIKRYHPWVFSGAIKKMDGPAMDGAHAEVFSNKDEYLGSGIYQDATIAVRLLAFAPQRPATFDIGFWQEKLRKAWELRSLADLTDNSQTNVYRLVHGEGDHLPGIIIDHYNGHLVLQIHATGLYRFIDEIAESLKTIYGRQLKSIYDKSRETLPATFWSDKKPKEFFYGEADSVEVTENGLKFFVDIEKGQKTGFFIDQRENRKHLMSYANGKRVLNTFAYTGGFSVYALEAGATIVDSVDSSARAMSLCSRNVALNGFQDKHRAITDDVMDYFRTTDQTYDVIVLDPPAYAKHQHVKHKAVQGYKRLNLEAIKSVAPGGVIFTFSCSQVVDMRLFYATVTSAAILAGRRVRVLHQLHQPADHPINMFHPEGHYLKGLVLAVD